MATAEPGPIAVTHATDEISPIDAALEKALRLGDGTPPRLAEAMRYSVLTPGKRLRPRLALKAAIACGGDAEAAMPAACSVELIHAYSLVHDDLPAMDDDDLRRGMPTCHARFGEAIAILVGDALQARAFELLATEIQPPEVAVRCCAELARAAGAENLVGGQADDLVGAFDGATVEDLRNIHARKTGALFVVSLRMGAIAAQATHEQLESITEYGCHLGLAFQVTDDLLDAHGEEAAVGKRVGKDAELGKLTYPSLMGVEASRRFASEQIAAACGAVYPFGERATPLIHLAESVLGRKN